MRTCAAYGYSLRPVADINAGAAGSAFAAGAASATDRARRTMPRMAWVAEDAVDAGATGTAYSTSATWAEKACATTDATSPARSTNATRGPGDANPADTSRATDPTSSTQKSAGATRTASPTDLTRDAVTTGPTTTTVPEQASCPARTAVLSGRPRSARAAVPPQQPSGPTVLPGSGGADRTITDQRTPQYQLGGRIDHTQHRVLKGLQWISAGRLGGPVRCCAGAQRLHKLVVKQCRLRTQCPPLLPKVTEDSRNRHRNLVLSRRRYRCGMGRRSRPGQAESVADVG